MEPSLCLGSGYLLVQQCKVLVDMVPADTGGAPLRAGLLSVAAKMAGHDAPDIVARSLDLGHAVYLRRDLVEQ